MLQENKLSPAKTRWFDFALLAGIFFLLFWALGSRGLWAAEGRWAQITREMLLTGDFFHPTMAGLPYFDKPLLTYWFIAIVSFITRNLDEWTLRIPSAIAGLLSIWATKNLATRLWSKKVGYLAAWMLLTTYGCLFWSRTGTAETENLAAIILAVAWYWARRDKPNFNTFVVFYLIIFLGAMTKGLATVVIPPIVIFPDLLREKRWRALLKPSHFLALAVGIGVYFFPSIYSSVDKPDTYESSSLGLVFRENVIRYFKPFDHKGPVYQYLYSIPVLMFPWAPLVVAAVLGMGKTYKSQNDNTKWLLKAMALIFIFFTLSGSRRGYYILPILPFCAILIAIFLTDISNKKTEFFRRWGIDIQNGLLFVLVIADLIAPIVLIILKPKLGYSFPPALNIATFAIGITALALMFMSNKYLRRKGIESKDERNILTNIIIATVILGGYYCIQEPIMDSSRTHRPFAMQMKSNTADFEPESIGMLHRNAPKMLFYLDKDRPVTIIHGDQQLRDFLDSETAQILIAQKKDLVHFDLKISEYLQREPDMEEGANPWESDSSKERKWVVWLLNKPAENETLKAESEK